MYTHIDTFIFIYVIKCGLSCTDYHETQKILNDILCNRLVSNYQLNAHFLYYITIYVLHYNPQHVSSSTLLILRRTNCIITASGIVTLCKQL